MFYRKCSIFDATPISRCPRVRHFIRQKSKMQYAITLSKSDQERSTRKLGVIFDAVGGSTTCTGLSGPDEVPGRLSSWRYLDVPH